MKWHPNGSQILAMFILLSGIGRCLGREQNSDTGSPGGAYAPKRHRRLIDADVFAIQASAFIRRQPCYVVYDQRLHIPADTCLHKKEVLVYMCTFLSYLNEANRCVVIFIKCDEVTRRLAKPYKCICCIWIHCIWRVVIPCLIGYSREPL